MARFWKSLRNADIVEGSDGSKFLKLEGNAFFMGNANSTRAASC